MTAVMCSLAALMAYRIVQYSNEHVKEMGLRLTADFSSADLLTAFNIILLFCWQVQHKSLIGFPTTI